MSSVDHAKVDAVNKLYEELHPAPNESTEVHSEAREGTSQLEDQGFRVRRPSYKQMIRRELKRAQTANGKPPVMKYTSRAALDDALWRAYYVDSDSSVRRSTFRKRLRSTLEREVEMGTLLRRKHSYRLPLHSPRRGKR